MSIKLWVKSQEGASYLCNLQPFSETYNCNTATKLWNCSRLQVTFYAFCGYSICNFFLLKHIEVVKCLPILIWLYVEWLTLPLADKFQTAASSGWTVKYFVNGFYFSLSVRLYLLLSGCHQQSNITDWWHRVDYLELCLEFSSCICHKNGPVWFLVQKCKRSTSD